MAVEEEWGSQAGFVRRTVRGDREGGGGVNASRGGGEDATFEEEQGVSVNVCHDAQDHVLLSHTGFSAASEAAWLTPVSTSAPRISSHSQ